MAKSRKSKSKRELEKEGRALGIELDRRRNKETLISELEAVESSFSGNEENQRVGVQYVLDSVIKELSLYPNRK